MRAAFVAVRVAGVAAVLAAVTGQLSNVLDYWGDRGLDHRGSTIVNFFSFFTIDSNLLTVVAFAIGAVRLVRRLDDSPAFAAFRACVTTYMVITGTVYNVLLRDIELAEGLSQRWSNEILHVVAPLLVLVDWLGAPGRRPVAWRRLAVVLAFPVAWTTYTLLRGPHVENEATGTTFWYPYPFLDPNEFASGYLGVAFFVALIAAAFVAVSSAVIWLSHRPTPAFVH